MAAKPVVMLKRVTQSGAIIDIKVWQLPHRTAERPHGLKYSLFFGRPGERLIGYDNEAGKGDHCHYGPQEKDYAFVSMEQLFEDFFADIAKLEADDE